MSNASLPMSELATLLKEHARYEEALEKIAALNMPYRDLASRAKHLARQALEPVSAHQTAHDNADPAWFGNQEAK